MKYLVIAVVIVSVLCASSIVAMSKMLPPGADMPEYDFPITEFTGQVTITARAPDNTYTASIPWVDTYGKPKRFLMSKLRSPTTLKPGQIVWLDKGLLIAQMPTDPPGE
jgi:hypothetical protein